MAYEFFFSYTRSNNDSYLKRLFRDLRENVRLKLGLPQSAEVGFFDQRDIELGADWDATLVSALQQSKVLVAIASPAYFLSDYCGREWALFRQRCLAAAGASGKPPPLLKSLVWVPYPIDGLPADVKAAQLTFSDPGAVQNTAGFRHLLLQIQKYRTVYNDLIEQLGSEIVEAGRAHPMAPLAQVPALADVPTAFAAAATPAAAPPAVVPPATVPSGPKHVHFIYVAASPNDFGAARPADPYVEVGGSDWRPFYPVDARRVHPLLQGVAARDDLQFSSTEAPFDADLIDRIERAWQQRQIVVIVVDPWSLHWDAQRPQPAYQALLRALDGRLDYHWCVLVPWNDSDAAAAAERDAITAVVRDTFDRHATLSPNPMFFRDGIASADELKSAVADVLTRLKEEIKKRAPVLRPIPAGPARLVVSGPSPRA